MNMKLFQSSSWVGPINFSASSFDEAVETVLDSVQNHKFVGHIHFANAYTIAIADRNLEYLKLFQGDAVNFPDGKPISWVSWIRRDKFKLTQIRGPEFFELCLDKGRSAGVKHFFLGGTDETLQTLTSVVMRKFPGIQIAGTHSPPFRTQSIQELEEQDLKISKTQPDIVWVGLGTPKQDYECKRLTCAIGVTTIAVGAAFSFTAGTILTCPRWVSRLGLEWLFRLTTEPKRLWKRYIFGNPQFIRTVIKPHTVIDEIS